MRTILLLLSLVFLPFSAFARNSCITNNNTPNQGLLIPVLDTEGNPLNKSSMYYIVQADGRGSVSLANLGDQEDNTCPTSVVESPIGISLYFKPKNDTQEEIVESSSVFINFTTYTFECKNLTVWKVDNFPKPAEHYTISTGAKLGNHVKRWFQIKALSLSSYKLVFCPYGGEFPCYNIGIKHGKGYRRLVLSDTPEAFVFKHDKRIWMATE